MENFAIAGTGGIAKTHAAAIKSIEGAALTACYNHNREKGLTFAAEQDCRFYDSLDGFLSAGDIDTVVITTPSGAHLDIAIQAMERGLDVMIEKPLEVTSARCRAIAECAERTRRRVGVIFQNRYFSSVQLIRKALAEGRFGRLVLANASLPIFRSQAYYDSAAWRGTTTLDGGGVLMNQGIHTIDLLLYLAGDAVSVSAYTGCLSHERIEVEDTAVIALQYTSGAMGTISATTSDYPGFPRRIELYGTEGSAVLENEILKVWSFKTETAEDSIIREKYSQPEASFVENNGPGIDCICHRREYIEFIEAKKNGSSFPIDAEEGTRAVRIIEAAYESAASGKCVLIST